MRDPRIDKITFTGSTAAGRKIGAICGERIAALHPRARRQVGRGDPRRRRHRRRPPPRSPAAECVMTGQVCSSLTRIVVHAHASRRDGRRARGELRRRSTSATRSTSRRRWARSPRSVSAPRRGLHRQGHRRGRDARGRWAPPEGPRARLVRRADRLRQRRQRVDDRAGGDLRPGPQRDPRRRRARRGPHRERHDLRAQLRGVHARRRPRPRRRRGTSAPARSGTTRSAPTSASRSAASSSRASVARAASRVCGTSSRRRP